MEDSTSLCTDMEHKSIGTLFLNGSFWAQSGRNIDSPFLYLVDLKSESDGVVGQSRSTLSQLTQIRLPMPAVVTALEYHPNLHLIICGLFSSEIVLIGERMSGKEETFYE